MCGLTVMMLLGTKVRCLACSMSNGGLEDAIFGMEHWKEYDSTRKPFQPLSSRNTLNF